MPAALLAGVTEGGLLPAAPKPYSVYECAMHCMALARLRARKTEANFYLAEIGFKCFFLEGFSNAYVR